MLHIMKVTNIHRKWNTVSGNNMNSKPKRILCILLPQCQTQLLIVFCRISTGGNMDYGRVACFPNCYFF